MNTLKAPANMSNFNIAGTAYIADEHGHIHSDNPDHIETLKRFGCFDPATEPDPEAVAASAEPVTDGEREEFALTQRKLDVAVTQVAERDDIINRTHADFLRIADALAENGHEIADGETIADAVVRVLGTAPATDAAEHAADAPGGTSGQQEDHAGADDAPKLMRPSEDASRDDLVEWLTKAGVEDVSPSIAKAKAWELVEAKLAA